MDLLGVDMGVTLVILKLHNLTLLEYLTTITPLLRAEGRYCSLDTIIQVSILWDPWH